MKATFVLILCFCSIQLFYSQENDGVVSFNIPMRNSLTFNRFAINPTFSFVREQTKYISLYNKREWLQFDDAPLTYLASYSGRFGENVGAGLGVFQQNYGVLTTFGANLNFAYNIQLAADNNLTFGLNVGAYKSGINTGNVVTNFDDPSLQNVPENFLLSINPGINYGSAFFDFGVSLNNLVLYNFESSAIIKENPQQGIQAHIMYTGYMMNSRGFFDGSKFTSLVKSEFQKENTIVSANAMLTVPKGIWAQVGYNSKYGISGGAGINITSQIAIEYNYEKGIGDLTNFGPSHDFTLAYRFKSNNRYNYNGDEEISGLLISDKRKPVLAKNSNVKTKAEREELLKVKAAADAKRLAEQKAKLDAQAEAKRLAEEKTQAAAQIEAKRLAELKIQQEADAQAKKLADQKALQEAEANAKRLAAQKAQQDAETKARRLAEQKAQQEADALAKRLAEQKAQQDAKAQAIKLAEQQAQQEAEAQLLAEQKAQQEADAQAKQLAEEKAEEDLISKPTDELGKSMYAITQETEGSKTTQAELLEAFDAIIQIKDKDLKDLKEENDLSEKGIAVGPKPFKSITEENARLENIKIELEDVIKKRNEKIEQLKALYEDNFEADTITNDVVYLFYQKTLKRLESEQLATIGAKSNLETRLAEIKVATEFERRRRIKRAAFDNEQERYSQDRATLINIKKTTRISETPIEEAAFDFGEEQSSNIQIKKNIQNVSNGYYVVLAVHSDVEKRNDFLTNVVASGQSNVDFFYDVNTSKYYIYYEKFDSIQEANRTLQVTDDKPYNKKRSLIKIEN